MSQWREITEVQQWEDLYESGKPTVVLKHSTRCSVSTNAYNEFEQYLAAQPADVDYVLVKVIESRPVSNKIAEDTGVTHASPQILYIENKHTVWNASHWAITQEHMKAVLD